MQNVGGRQTRCFLVGRAELTKTLPSRGLQVLSSVRFERRCLSPSKFADSWAPLSRTGHDQGNAKIVCPAARRFPFGPRGRFYRNALATDHKHEIRTVVVLSPARGGVLLLLPGRGRSASLALSRILAAHTRRNGTSCHSPAQFPPCARGCSDFSEFHPPRPIAAPSVQQADASRGPADIVLPGFSRVASAARRGSSSS